MVCAEQSVIISLKPLKGNQHHSTTLFSFYKFYSLTSLFWLLFAGKSNLSLLYLQYKQSVYKTVEVSGKAIIFIY